VEVAEGRGQWGDPTMLRFIAYGLERGRCGGGGCM
jgi:hypothetical protein